MTARRRSDRSTDEQKRTADAAETIKRFLKWNPQNIQFRLAHAQ